MFQDIGVSKNLIEQYRTYCEKRKLDDIGKDLIDPIRLDLIEFLF